MNQSTSVYILCIIFAYHWKGRADRVDRLGHHELMEFSARR